MVAGDQRVGYDGQQAPSCSSGGFEALHPYAPNGPVAGDVINGV